MKVVVSSFILLALCSVGRAAPVPPCVAGTLQDYIGLGSDGCTFGGATFYNFGDSTVFGATPGAIQIGANAIQVTPFGDLNSPGFIFQVNALSGAGELRQARVGYTMALANPGTVTAHVGMTGSSVEPDGVNTVVKELCPGGEFFFPSFCPDPDSFGLLPTEALIAFDIGVDASLAESLLLAPLTRLGVLDDIVVDGGLAGIAELASATNQFTIVPEPGTVWCLSAFMACAWLRSRRRREHELR